VIEFLFDPEDIDKSGFTLRAPAVDRASESEQNWPIGSLNCGFTSGNHASGAGDETWVY
jgi:hypothetical protein